MGESARPIRRCYLCPRRADLFPRYDSLGNQQMMHGRGCLGALTHPVQNPLLPQQGLLGLGVMRAQNLNLPGCGLAAPLREHNPKRRIISPPDSLKPNHQHTEKYI